MKTFKSLSTIFSIVAVAATPSFADWVYDPANPDANIIDDNINQNVADYIIDTRDGTLTVTGQFANKAQGTLIVGSNTADALSANSFTVQGSWMQNHSVATLESVNITASSIFNESNGSKLYVKGVTTVSGSIVTKNQASLTIYKGGSLKAGTAEFGASSGEGRLEIENGVAGTLVVAQAMKVDNSATVLSIGLSNDSLANSNAGIIQTQWAKAMNGTIEIDLSNFALSSDFVMGTEYTIAIVFNSSNQTAAGQFDDTWKILESNVTNGNFAEFVSSHKDNYRLYITIRAIPEPAAFAAVFGALAIALAVYRRKRS